MSSLIEKLQSIKDRWIDVSQQIVDPEIIADMDRYVKLNKEYSDLKVIVDAFDDYTNVLANIDSSREILSNEKDEEFREMAKIEFDELQKRKITLEDEIKIMLIPKDPDDNKNVIIEIRAGAGGDEASIFAGDLYRMYVKYIEGKGWKHEVTTINEGTSGGFKEIGLEVSGNNVYGIMKYESGVHRVQRVPQTETQGRVHTSAASVAVLPEADCFRWKKSWPFCQSRWERDLLRWRLHHCILALHCFSTGWWMIQVFIELVSARLRQVWIIDRLRPGQ